MTDHKADSASKETRHYLEVPFVEKDEAKALGARWDLIQKKWYYTGRRSKKYEKWLPAHIMQSSELSDEQQEMIELVKSGKNVLVDACIGSGKTTTIQVLCNEITEKNILYLTYNKLLKVDAKSKITTKNVTVTNYHGFASKCLQKANIPSSVSELILTFLKNSDKIKLPIYDILIIDEYQDIDSEISDMLECIKSSNPEMQIVAVGDMKQKIYDKTTLNVAEFIDRFLDEYVAINFTKCFRLCDDLAKDLGNVWEKEINGKNNTCRLYEMRSDEVVPFLAQQKTSDILCLGSRNGKMAKVLNELEKKHSDKFNKRTVYASISDEDSGGTTEPNKTTAIFTTYDGSKGLERKICVIFDYTYEYWDIRKRQPDVRYEILRNIFCVAMSRGKEKIIVVTDTENKRLSYSTIAKPFRTNKKYSRPFSVSKMFDFKYDEDIRNCYDLLRRRKLKTSDNSIVDVESKDFMIDLSPCIGIYQEVDFFEKYDINKQILYTKAIHYDRSPLSLKEDATLDEKVLYLTAYETYQDRYYRQVRPPFLTSEQIAVVHKRLRRKFTGNEDVQNDFTIKLLDEKDNKYKIIGRADVVKDKIVYELKFVDELKYIHFLQLACCMIGLGLEKGVLWNVKNNERYVVSIPDKEKFMRYVVLAITKGAVKDSHISEITSYFEEDCC